MEEKNLQDLFSEIRKAQNELNAIQGSLESMMTVDMAVEDVLQKVTLKEKHVKHMKACNQVFMLNMQRLQEKQADLIKLLVAQQSKLQRLLQIQCAARDLRNTDWKCWVHTIFLRWKNSRV